MEDFLIFFKIELKMAPGERLSTKRSTKSKKITIRTEASIRDKPISPRERAYAKF